MAINKVDVEEVLRLSLATDDPQIHAKVYQIIERSGVDPSDPMFLVLALTGQIKAFLETAMVDLRQLLSEWKQQNFQSLSEIQRATDDYHQNYDNQVEAFLEGLRDATEDYADQIKQVGMATVSAISEANSETLTLVMNLQSETKQLLDQTNSLRHNIESDRQKYNDSITAVAEQFKQITNELKQANLHFKSSTIEIKKFQQQVSWQRQHQWLSPLFALVVVGILGAISGGWLTARFYNSPIQKIGRHIAEANQQQIAKCLERKQRECLLNLQFFTDK